MREGGRSYNKQSGSNWSIMQRDSFFLSFFLSFVASAVVPRNETFENRRRRCFDNAFMAARVYEPPKKLAQMSERAKERHVRRRGWILGVGGVGGVGGSGAATYYAAQLSKSRAAALDVLIYYARIMLERGRRSRGEGERERRTRRGSGDGEERTSYVLRSC